MSHKKELLRGLWVGLDSDSLAVYDYRFTVGSGAHTGCSSGAKPLR